MLDSDILMISYRVMRGIVYCIAVPAEIYYKKVKGEAKGGSGPVIFTWLGLRHKFRVFPAPMGLCFVISQ